MDVGVLALLCVVRSVSLITHLDESYQMWCVWAWSWNHDNGVGDKIDSVFMFCPSFNSMEYYFFLLKYHLCLLLSSWWHAVLVRAGWVKYTELFFLFTLKVGWKFWHVDSVIALGLHTVNSNVWCFICNMKLMDAVEKNTEQYEYCKCVFTFHTANTWGTFRVNYR